MTRPTAAREGAARGVARDRQAFERMLTDVRAAGLKITPQRRAIIRELAGDLSHPTAQELFDRLRPELPTMSFATVYNTLSSLASAGLCVARSLSRGPTRFDPNVALHDHAVCDSCGMIADVPRTDAAAGPAVEGFSVHAIERIYRGTCAACSAPASNAPASHTGADPGAAPA